MRSARFRARFVMQHAWMPPRTLHVTIWADHPVETTDRSAISGYVEMFWLPVLGPSATFLLRRLGAGLESIPEGFSVGVDDLGRELGLGTSDSKNAPLQRAISRLVHFGLARRNAPGELSVRSDVGTLSRRHVSGLPEVLQEAHRAIIERERACALDLPANGPWPRADPRAGSEMESQMTPGSDP